MTETTPPSKNACQTGWMLALAGLLVGLFFVVIYLGIAQHQLVGHVQQLAAAQINQKSDLAGLLAKRLDPMAHQLSSLTSHLSEQQDAMSQNSQEIQALNQKCQFNREDWILYSLMERLRLINLNLNFDANRGTVLAALNKASLALQALDDPALFATRKSLARDIEAIQGLPVVDLPGIVTKLMAVQDTIMQLPLQRLSTQFVFPGIPIKQDKSEMSWQDKALRSLKAMEKIVIIRHHDEPIAPLLPKDQESYLRYNLFFMLQQAQWSAISGEPVVYKSSLDKAQQWMSQHFEKSDTHVQAQINTISQLASVPIRVQLPKLDETLYQLKKVLVTIHPKRAEASKI